MKEDLELHGTQGITFMLHFNKIAQIVPKFEYANPAQQNDILSNQSHYTNQCAGLVVTWGWKWPANLSFKCFDVWPTY